MTVTKLSSQVPIAFTSYVKEYVPAASPSNVTVFPVRAPEVLSSLQTPAWSSSSSKSNKSNV